jgi:Holliday junction resolvasome RuvABC endonuclease subunit
MQKDMTIFLSLFPNTRGLGYACVETPQTLVDYGVVTVQPVSNEKVFARAKKFIDFFRPTVIVIRDTDDPVTRRAGRIQSLVEAITKYAQEQNIPVYRYSRNKIKEVFEINGIKTKHDIAQQIAQWFPELAPRLPKVRRAWMDEDYNMGVFDALALVATHRYLTE